MSAITRSRPATPLDVLRDQQHVSALYEFAAIHRLPRPIFNLKQSNFADTGSPHVIKFIYKVTMKIADQKYTAEGFATTKKGAKKIAAKNLCESFRKND